MTSGLRKTPPGERSLLVYTVHHVIYSERAHSFRIAREHSPLHTSILAHLPARMHLHVGLHLHHPTQRPYVHYVHVIKALHPVRGFFCAAVTLIVRRVLHHGE